MQGKTFINFKLNTQGKVESMNIESISEFTRAPDPEAAPVAISEAELKKFVGKYVLAAPPLEISIELVGSSLKANVPGQPLYTMIPIAADRFRLEGAPAGFIIQFEVADGKTKSLTLIQGSRPAIVLLPKQ
jgi:hypothetical protein